MCRDLFAQLFPKLRDRRKGIYPPYKSTRFQIVHLELDDKRQHVLVLDNIAKLSVQKLSLVQYLTLEKRFRVVAITESFLPAEQFRRLRARLSPVSVVTLDHLSVYSVRKFFSYCSERYGFGWRAAQINGKVTTTGGYPLGMKEAVARELESQRRLMSPEGRVIASKLNCCPFPRRYAAGARA